MVEVNSDAELVALIDSDTSKKEELESTFKVPFASTEDFKDQGIEVDVVNVCTPKIICMPFNQWKL